MKFFSFSASLTLASMFCERSLATITIEDLPSTVGVGATYEVKWYSDRDYVSVMCCPLRLTDL